MKMKLSKKSIKVIIFVLIGIVLIAALIYFGIKSFGDLSEQKDYDDLSESMRSSSQEEVEPEKTERMVKLEELHSQYEDVVAWLDVPGTSLSYPIVQADDNDYYLDHTYKKEYSARGSIFLDKDADFDRPSDNFLIYGHRNQNGAMFEDLMKYEKEDFYKEHTKIEFTTLKEDAEYEIIAAFRSRVYYKSEKNVFRYYYFINAQNEAEFNEYVSSAKQASMYHIEPTAQYGDQLLTLSTCAYHTENGRFAVVAKKINKQTNEVNTNTEGQD